MRYGPFGKRGIEKQTTEKPVEPIETAADFFRVYEKIDPELQSAIEGFKSGIALVQGKFERDDNIRLDALAEKAGLPESLLRAYILDNLQ